MPQAWQDKQVQFQGSQRMFYSGCPLNSGAAWNWVGFSGTNSGFGTHSNEECNRFAIESSGTSIGQFSFDNGTSLHGEVFGSEAKTFDGVQRSGVWLRSEADSQNLRVWGW